MKDIPHGDVRSILWGCGDTEIRGDEFRTAVSSKEARSGHGDCSKTFSCLEIPCAVDCNIAQELHPQKPATIFLEQLGTGLAGSCCDD